MIASGKIWRHPDPAACTFAVCRDVRYAAVDTGALEMDVYGPPEKGLFRREDDDSVYTSLEDRADFTGCSSLELRDPLALGVDHRHPRNFPAGRGERPEVDFLALMRRATRILAVTVGLMVAGAVFGGIAGATALGIAVALTDRIANAADFGMLAFAAWFGAIVGAVAAPAAGWLLLRRVPLGRAVGWTTLGAVTGGIGGWLLAIALRSEIGRGLPFLGNAIESGIAGAVVGFVVAAVLARRRSSRHGPIDRVETPVVR